MPHQNFKIILGVFVFCIIYITFQTQIAINHDVIWLVTAAERLYNGMPYLQAAYETNLPSSILLYFPVATLISAGLNFITSVYIYGFIIYIGLLILAAVHIYRTFNDDPHIVKKILFFSAAYIIGLQYDFLQRDTIIALMLIPYVCSDYFFLKRSPSKTYVIPLLSMSFACLVKPHYAVVPLCFYALRLIKNPRSFTLWHFLIPASSIAITVGFYWTAYPEFFKIILPDILDIYVGDNVSKIEGQYNKLILIYCYLIILSFCLFYFKNISFSKNLHRFEAFLTVFSLLCFFTYLWQNKGFPYHFYPSLISITTVICLLLWRDKRTKILAVLFFAFIIGGETIHTYKENLVSSREKQALNTVLKDNFEPGTFSLAYYNMLFPHSIHAYTEFENVSRFPSIWFYELFKDSYDNNPDVMKKREKLYQLYFDDLRQKKPNYIIVLYLKKERDNALMNYSLNKAQFNSYWNNNYSLAKSGDFPASVYSSSYSPLIMNYDIYQNTAVVKQDN